MNLGRTLCTMLVAAATLTGCTQRYASYPEVPSSKGLKQDPNDPACEKAMVAALRYVGQRYAPGKPRLDAANSKEAGDTRVDEALVVNLPRGLRKSYYERIARDVGPQVTPMREDSDHSLPVFHVTRVWLRFSEGWVDVMRPMPELPPGPDGKLVYQTVTLKMAANIGSWRVVHARAFEPGLDPVPEPYYVPDIERGDQYQQTVHGNGDYPQQFRKWEAHVKEGRSGQPEEAEETVPASKEGNAAPESGGDASKPEAPVEMPDDKSGPVVKPAEPK